MFLSYQKNKARFIDKLIFGNSQKQTIDLFFENLLKTRLKINGPMRASKQSTAFIGIRQQQLRIGYLAVTLAVLQVTTAKFWSQPPHNFSLKI